MPPEPRRQLLMSYWPCINENGISHSGEHAPLINETVIQLTGRIPPRGG